jgi:hypothetical protein
MIVGYRTPRGNRRRTDRGWWWGLGGPSGPRVRAAAIVDTEQAAPRASAAVIDLPAARRFDTLEGGSAEAPPFGGLRRGRLRRGGALRRLPGRDGRALHRRPLDRPLLLPLPPRHPRARARPGDLVGRLVGDPGRGGLDRMGAQRVAYRPTDFGLTGCRKTMLERGDGVMDASLVEPRRRGTRGDAARVRHRPARGPRAAVHRRRQPPQPGPRLRRGRVHAEWGLGRRVRRCGGPRLRPMATRASASARAPVDHAGRRSTFSADTGRYPL